MKRIKTPVFPLDASNTSRWANYLICSLLSRDLQGVIGIKDKIQHGVFSMREELKNYVANEQSAEKTSTDEIVRIQLGLLICETTVHYAEAFYSGNGEEANIANACLQKAISSALNLRDYDFVWVLRTIGKVLSRIWLDSPWVRLREVIARPQYIQTLVEDGIVNLWTSQIVALEMKAQISPLLGGYLDARIKRVVINMPTSAGKTLIAELAIAQQVLGKQKNRCIYIAPSRALRDQVASDLSTRLGRFGIRFTATVSDSELSAYDSLLFQQSTVLVVTPEKLSQLIRQKSDVLLSVSLFIFDELHNIGNGERGWTYEQLISMLLQDSNTRNAKMIFMSAVMPNHLTVQEWVDPDRICDTIHELWQPTRLLKGAISFGSYRPNVTDGTLILSGDLIYVRDKTEINSPFKISGFITSKQVKDVQATNSRHSWKRNPKESDGEIQHAVAAAKRFMRLGSVLVYCPKRNDAVEFCRLAVDQIQDPHIYLAPDEQKRFQEVVQYIEDRMPPNHPLVRALRHGIAFHHGTLPADIRTEIEMAFKKGWIRLLAATSTLVEGVNLPVKTLILCDYCTSRKPNMDTDGWTSVNPLSFQNFRNISGRAGRASFETEGQVILIQSLMGFPFPLPDKSYQNYLAIEPDSAELAIRSSLDNQGLINSLYRLVDQIDNGLFSDAQLLFGSGEIDTDVKLTKLVDQLNRFVLLLQDQKLTDNDRESFVKIFQRTFLGNQMPSSAPEIMGSFAVKSAKALNSLIGENERSLFAQAGLSISTCRSLLNEVRTYWQGMASQLNDLSEILSWDLLRQIGELIYANVDVDMSPVEVNISARKKARLASDSEFLADWITTDDEQELMAKHFAIIKDPALRAEQFVNYIQQTTAYRTPWLLSCFWIFSKAVVQEKHDIDLSQTAIGKELMLLPAYAKFGVNNPAAALFSTLGLAPASMAMELSGFYYGQYGLEGNNKYDYVQMLEWLMNVEPEDLARQSNLSPFLLRRLVRILHTLSAHISRVVVSDRWEVEFPVAGWQYYDGDGLLGTLSVGTEVELRPERGNSHDEHAIQIYTSSNQMLGYVPRTLSATLSKRLNSRPISASLIRIDPTSPANQRAFILCHSVL